MTTRLTFTLIRSGQPRAYADSEDVGHLLVEHREWDHKTRTYKEEYTHWSNLPQDTLRRYASAFMRWEESDGSGSMEDAFRPKLDFIAEVSPGNYEILVRSKYTD